METSTQGPIPELFELELLGEGTERRYRRARPEVEGLPWGSIDTRGFDPQVLVAARRSWTSAAFQEHRTAAACSAVSAAGMPGSAATNGLHSRVLTCPATGARANTTRHGSSPARVTGARSAGRRHGNLCHDGSSHDGSPASAPLAGAGWTFATTARLRPDHRRPLWARHEPLHTAPACPA